VRAAAPDGAEASLLFLNCDKARKDLGWQTRWGSSAPSRRPMRWYRKVFDGESVRTTTEGQIRAWGTA
jgi:nucleoside-diphosphate-sugar epimerase